MSRESRIELILAVMKGAVFMARGCKSYNDYTLTVKRWLKSYNRFSITIENLQEGIADKQHELDHDVNAPVSRYDAVAGGTSELNMVERAAGRHMHIRQEIEDMKQSIFEIQASMRKIDRALDGLSETDRRLVEGHYFQGMAWEKLGSELFYSEKWARERAGKAVKEMAIMIFGPKASGQRGRQLQYIFAR